MKSTGFTRTISRLGILDLPRELLKVMDIHPNDSLLLTIEGESIVLKKITGDYCVFCGAENDLTLYEGKAVCPGCIRDLKKRMK